MKNKRLKYIAKDSIDLKYRNLYSILAVEKGWYRINDIL